MKKNCLICLKSFETKSGGVYCSLECSLHGKNGKRRDSGTIQGLLQVLIEAHGHSLLMDGKQYHALRNYSNWLKVTETTFAIGTKGYYVALTKRGATAARQFLDLV